MKKIIILGLTVILIAVSVYTVDAYNTSRLNSNKVTKENSVENITPSASNTFNLQEKSELGKAQDFTLTDLKGKEFTLSNLKGKKVFLNFWATWCPPCRGEMPEIEKLYQETKDSDLVIITVDLGEPLDTVKSFINKNKYNFKVLLDKDQSVGTMYQISAIPTSYFIDKEGNIVSVNSGAMTIDEMKEHIDALE